MFTLYRKILYNIISKTQDILKLEGHDLKKSVYNLVDKIKILNLTISLNNVLYLECTVRKCSICSVALEGNESMNCLNYERQRNIEFQRANQKSV